MTVCPNLVNVEQQSALDLDAWPAESARAVDRTEVRGARLDKPS